MKLKVLSPRKSLNKAFLKVKPVRSEIEDFKANLAQLLDRIDEDESEEFHKNLVIKFLNDTWYCMSCPVTLPFTVTIKARNNDKILNM